MSNALGNALAANVAMSSKLRGALSEVVYQVGFQAISLTFAVVVRQTWHDSSNAAANWYVLSDNQPLPAYSPLYGKFGVGSKYSYRSRDHKTNELDFVSSAKLASELSSIKSHFNRKGSDVLKFYNAVENYQDEFEGNSGQYAINAEIYGTLHNPEVVVTFNKTTASNFQKWASKNGF